MAQWIQKQAIFMLNVYLDMSVSIKNQCSVNEELISDKYAQYT